jgi:hypothetical protein
VILLLNSEHLYRSLKRTMITTTPLTVALYLINLPKHQLLHISCESDLWYVSVCRHTILMLRSESPRHVRPPCCVVWKLISKLWDLTPVVVSRIASPVSLHECPLCLTGLSKQVNVTKQTDYVHMQALTYLLLPRCRIFFEKLIVTQLVKQ